MRVTVLGGGIGGLEAAIFLRKYKFDVTLVSNREYLYLYPTSIWIPTGKRRFEDVALPLEQFAKVHTFDLIIDEVKRIKPEQKKVQLVKEDIEYETLVIAMGSGKMPIEGVEHAPSICGKPGDAIILKNSYEKLLEKGSGVLNFGFGANPKDSSAVRGGPAFELILNVLNDLKRRKVRDKFTLNFFAPMPRPGQKMGDKAVDMMIKLFTKEGIGMHFGTKISKFSSKGVHFADETVLEGDYTMFIAAGAGHSVIQESSLPTSESGFIKIDEFCQVQGHEDIFAVGDVAEITGHEWRAKQGHLAEAMARAVAGNLKARREGKKMYHSYTSHMNIICLMDNGKNAALVYRSPKRAFMLPLPVIGHIAKRGWGWYYKNSKLKRVPRIKGM